MLERGMRTTKCPGDATLRIGTLYRAKTACQLALLTAEDECLVYEHGPEVLDRVHEGDTSMSRDARKTWGHRGEDFTGDELKGRSSTVGFAGVEGPHRGIIAVAAFLAVVGIAFFVT